MESQQLTMAGSDFAALVQQANRILAGAVPQDEESLAAVVAEHLSAPVRATMVGAAGGLGMLVRLTQAADGALIVAQPVRDVEGRTVPDGSVQLSYAPSPSWRELAELLPPVEALRAAAVQGTHSDGCVVVLPDPAGGEVEASLHLRVEAWIPGVETPKVWVHAWVVFAMASCSTCGTETAAWWRFSGLLDQLRRNWSGQWLGPLMSSPGLGRSLRNDACDCGKVPSLADARWLTPRRPAGHPWFRSSLQAVRRCPAAES